MAAFDEHEAALRSKIERLKSNPESMFLPLGAMVRFTGAPSHVNSLGILQESSDRDYPAPGSIGVVTRLNHRGEHPIGVIMRREFRNGYGDTFFPDYESMPTFLVDPEKIEVLGPGLLPGNRVSDGYGFVPTHAPIDDDDEFEMIVEAD